MKQEYIKRFKVEFKLSPRQLEQMSAHHLINWFMDISSNSLKDIPNINPEWIEQQRYKDMDCWYLDELKKVGDFRDTGRFKVRKVKKGYVLEMKFNWRSKGIKKTQYLCRRCKKDKLLNFELICKRCESYLKKNKKYSNFWMKNKSVLKGRK